MSTHVTLDTIVALCKRRGFIYAGSDIYGGLSGTFDYGPLGLALKKNIERLWWEQFVDRREDMFGLDSAILMHPRVWEASGHVEGFNDPLVEDILTRKRYRADHLLEAAGVEVEGLSLAQMAAAIAERGIKSPDGNPLSEPRQFNMMFRTSVGSVEGGEMPVYLRPETAQGMFVNFKNILDSFHPKLPFGIAQIGRSFRNEISPRDFLFRVRELEIMEFEYFIRETEWEKWFEYWRTDIHRFAETLGLAPERLVDHEVPAADRAHYSKRTIDFYYQFPFGSKELFGMAYRTDYDLKRHQEVSGGDLTYFDDASGERFVPHVIEPTFGLGRTVLAVLSEALSEDELGGEKRVYLKLTPRLAPIKAAVFPLLKNKPDLVAKARAVYGELSSRVPQIMFDDNGNIGKRYRRQDEIGTPFCITVDFQTLEDGTVTVRERDTGGQRRVPAGELTVLVEEALRA